LEKMSYYLRVEAVPQEKAQVKCLANQLQEAGLAEPLFIFSAVRIAKKINKKFET